MKTSIQLSILAFGASLAVSAAAYAAEPAARVPSTIKYWDLWTGKDGMAHLNQCEFKNFALKTMKAPAAPQWQDILKAEGKVISTVQPVGWAGDWHEDPVPQFVITLKGKWYITANDGKHIEMGPGDILLGEDLHTKPNSEGHIGHLSGTVGDEDSQLMVVQLKDKAVKTEPCRFE